jgi:YD repeat-containing protein
MFVVLLLFWQDRAFAQFTPYMSSDDAWSVGKSIGGVCSVGLKSAHQDPYTSVIEPFIQALNTDCSEDDDYIYSYEFSSCADLQITYNQSGAGTLVSIPCTLIRTSTVKKTGYTGTNVWSFFISKGCLLYPYLPQDPELTYEPMSGWCRCFNSSALFLPDVAEGAHCRIPVDRFLADQPKMCSADVPAFGDPIYPTVGANRQEISLGVSIAGVDLKVRYDMGRKIPSLNSEREWLSREPPSFGPLWHGNLHRSIAVQPGRIGIESARGSGVWTNLNSIGNSRFAPGAPNPDHASSTSGNYSWEYYNLNESAIEYYSPYYNVFYTDSLPVKIAYSDGRTLELSYSDYQTPKEIAPSPGLMIKLTDQFSRSVDFRYEQPASNVTNALPRITKIIGTDRQEMNFEYNGNGYLSKIIWPDSRERAFFYQDTSFAWALTQIVDEDQIDHVSFSYDTEGRAESVTQLKGKILYHAEYGSRKPQWNIIEHLETTVGGSVDLWRDHYRVNPDPIQLVSPNNTSNLTTQLISGSPRLTDQTQPAGSGCSASSSSAKYDANSNLLSRVDFSNRKTCYAYDTVANAQKNLETVRVEGFEGSVACPADLSSYTIPSSLDADKPQRKITKIWHPKWRLESRVAEAKLITTSVYNRQTDPISGQALSCAPADAAVLCRRTEQPTTDTTGSSGFAAVADGLPRIWNYTYNRWGQKLSEDGPRTDVADVSTWEYYADTSTVAGSEHTLGDLKSMTNPAGHKTQYLRYDKAGRLLKSRAANGVLTEITYTPRGWVDVVSVTPATSGVVQLTDHDYWPTGLLKQVTQPDGSWTSYLYDGAHRLTDVSDNLGNSVHYTLDGMGNRTKEEFKDPAGVLARQIDRVYDALNRLQNFTGVGGTP